MIKGKYLFTSESVTEGHPDKICDQISDAILDACLEKDPDSRVAVECLTKTGVVVVSGELTTEGYVNIPNIVRDTLKEIGYNDCKDGIDYKTCGVLVQIEGQSPDISIGVTAGQGKYKETHSTSNCTDYQARRLNIKYRDNGKTEFVHTLNGTALAIGRTIIAIIENYQQKDGTIKVPKVLQNYLKIKVIK